MSRTTHEQRGADPGRLFAGMSSQEDTNELVQELGFLAKTASGDLRADTLVISIFQDDQLHTLGPFSVVSDGIPAQRHIIEDSHFIHEIKQGNPLNVADVRLDPDLRDVPGVERDGFTGCLAVPVDTAAYGVVGLICATTLTPRAWTSLEQSYLEQLARAVGCTLVARMRLVEQRHLSEELSALDRIIAALAADLSVPTSIYGEDGELAFLNASLADLVPINFVASFLANGQSDRGKGEIEASGGAVAIVVPGVMGRSNRCRISCSKSASGMTVCHWLPDLGEMN